MKVLIAVPTFENIYPDTFKSIYDLNRSGNELMFEYVRGYDCATARNAIAQKALDLGTDYVLMVDNDVVLPKDTIDLMLDEPVSVCLGYYAHRHKNNVYSGESCICKLLQPDGTYYFNYPLESLYRAEELKQMREAGQKKIRIHGGGSGCAFIHTDVFRELKYPWYDWKNYSNSHRGMLSEDLYFCEQCRKKHIPIYADVRVSCGHILRHTQYVD